LLVTVLSTPEKDDEKAVKERPKGYAEMGNILRQKLDEVREKSVK
jgi:hypothetical protein